MTMELSRGQINPSLRLSKPVKSIHLEDALEVDLETLFAGSKGQEPIPPEDELPDQLRLAQEGADAAWLLAIQASATRFHPTQPYEDSCPRGEPSLYP